MNKFPMRLRARCCNALFCGLLAAAPGAGLAGVATPSATAGGVYWSVSAPNGGVSLRVSMPDGSIFEQYYPTGQAPWFAPQNGGALPDGAYVYELVIAPILSAQERAQAAVARDTGQAVRLPAGSVESGVFRVIGGNVLLPDPTVVEPMPPVVKNGARAAAPGTGGATLKDQVIPDDLIVQGSACIGLDCVNNEAFGFDTIRLKENNLRIRFDDTSAGTGFPANNWQLTANDSASGGANKFSIEDITGAKVPFTITAGAPSNSLFLASNGHVGLGTSTPALDLHISTGNTPATRLEQTAAGGFTAQTWDIGANEANFFVRDVTGGSRLPFRIRPGAPTSSIDISASGFVGIGTSSPGSKLHLGGTATDDIFVGMGPNVVTGPAFNFGYGGTSLGRSAGFFNVRPDASAIAPNPSLRFMTQNIERMIITSSGAVGIGTSAPDQTFSVNGGASKIGGGSWLSFSDERLKDIKGVFSSGLKALLQLQPLRYEYRHDNALGLQSEGEHVGFGAHAVQKIIPEAVTRNREGYLMVDNDPILWTMLNAIKEQSAEIAQLKKQIKRLQAGSHKRE